MAKKDVLKVIRYFSARLKENGLNVSKIILFGSHSIGNPTDESDIDIAVISEDFRGKSLFKRIPLIKNARVSTVRKFIVPMDVVLMTPDELASETSPIAAYARSGKTISM